MTESSLALRVSGAGLTESSSVLRVPVTEITENSRQFQGYQAPK